MKEKSFYLNFVFALIANIYKWKVYCYIWVANEKRGIMQKNWKKIDVWKIFILSSSLKGRMFTEQIVAQ